MLDLEDGRWSTLSGGYRLPFDARPPLRQLAQESDSESAWSALSEELYHQGDVGEASYAAVPFLVDNCIDSSQPSWRLLALVSFVEVARTAPGNPPLPAWLEHDYHAAIESLALLSLTRLRHQNGTEELRGMLCVIALWKGLRTYADALLSYDEDELRDLLPLQT